MTGTGKSTLAKQLSNVLGVPYHSVDDLTFEANWVPVPPDEQRKRIQAICQGDSWILDSAYGVWLDVPVNNADCIVALDYPRLISLGWLVRRSLMRLVDGKPICNGNRETVWMLFSRKSIILWHFQSFSRKRARIRSWEGSSSSPPLIRLQSPNETKRWLLSITRKDVGHEPESK